MLVHSFAKKLFYFSTFSVDSEGDNNCNEPILTNPSNPMAECDDAGLNTEENPAQNSACPWCNRQNWDRVVELDGGPVKLMNP